MATNNQTLRYILGGGAASYFTSPGSSTDYTNTDFYKNKVAPLVKDFAKYSEYMEYNPDAPKKETGDWLGTWKNKQYADPKFQAGVPQSVKDWMAGKTTNDPFAKLAYQQVQYDRAQAGASNGEGGGITALAARNQSGVDFDQAYLKAFGTTLSPELQKIWNAPVANKDYGKKVGRGDAGALTAELTRLMEAGYSLKTASGSTANQIKRMAPDLARYGINSLNEIAATKVTNPYTGKQSDIFYSTVTGAIIPTSFGSSMKGEGGSDYKLINVNGRGVPMAQWRDTSEAADFAPLVMMAGLAAAPLLAPLSGAIGGALGGGAFGSIAGGAITGGLTQGTLAALSGGDFGKGFLTGAVGGAIGGGISSLSPGTSIANSFAPLGNTAAEATLNAAISSGIDKALAGGLGALVGSAINGGNLGSAGLSGAVAGAVSGLSGAYLGGTVGGALGSVAGSTTSGLLNSGGQGGGRQPVAAAAGTGATGYGSSTGLLASGGYGNPWQLTPKPGVGNAARAA